MKIGIIGCGAIGLLFAAYLSSKHDITVYARRIEQIDEISKNGLTLLQKEEKISCSVQVKHISEGVFHEELVIIALKQYDLSSLLKINGIETIPALLFLQNGMGHLSQVEKMNNPTILLGVVEHGAIKVNDSTVAHKGIGHTKFSIYRGDSESYKTIFSNQEMSEFQFQFVANWHQMLIDKLIVNAVINPLTAIFRVPNGELIENQYFHLFAQELFQEIVSALGLQNHSQLWKHVEDVCRNTAENRSSMLKDIEEGRKTEIDAILGYVLQQAAVSSLPLTTNVYHAIKGLELKRGTNR